MKCTINQACYGKNTTGGRRSVGCSSQLHPFVRSLSCLPRSEHVFIGRNTTINPLDRVGKSETRLVCRIGRKGCSALLLLQQLLLLLLLLWIGVNCIYKGIPGEKLFGFSIISLRLQTAPTFIGALRPRTEHGVRLSSEVSRASWSVDRLG